jgi:glycosidase
MRAVVDRYPDRLLIGELYLPIERLMAYYGVGVHLPANFHLISVDWQARRIAELIAAYEAALPAGAWPNWVLGNHDKHRVASRVGPAQARVAAMLLLTLRGTPTIYYGDEIGMTGEQDPGSRAAFPWQDEGSWDHDLLAFTRGVIALRRSEGVLRRGSYRTVAAWDQAMAYLRGPAPGTDGPPLVVVLNARDAAIPLELDVPELDGRTLELVTWPGTPARVDGDLVVRNGRVSPVMPARTGLVFRPA